MKKVSNISCGLNFLVKNSFKSLIVLEIRWLVPWISQNLILILNFILFIYQFFFCWRREKIVGFQFRERKCLLVRILATKTIIFYVKWFHMMRGVKIMCFFFFTLKTPKKSDLSLRSFFFCFRWISGLRVIFFVFYGHGLV